MKTYKVIALSVGALGNKIFKAGDTVLESNFKEGRADELVKQGFLELIPSEESNGNTGNQDELSKEDQELFDSVTAKDLKDDLTESKIPFKSNASKIELFLLWKSIDSSVE